MSRQVERVVIVGRDAELWLSACVLQSALGPTGVSVTAVELPTTLGAHDVYASLPALEALHSRLKIDESALLAAIGGAFSLGQNFIGGANASFFHPYGACGAPIEQRAFLPYWLMAHAFGLNVPLDDFSLTAVAAKHGRMLIPDASIDAYGRTDYAYHLPALGYAAWLKSLAIKRGVHLHHAMNVEVFRNERGEIACVDIGGVRVDGDLFVDASGREARLISALDVERESWHEYFPVDRRIVACGSRMASIPPYAEVRMTNGFPSSRPSSRRSMPLEPTTRTD
jgi:tryptophan halogenase